MYRSSPSRSTLNTGYISNNSGGLQGGLEATLIKGGCLKVTIRGWGFTGGLRFQVPSGGLEGGYFKGGVRYLQRGLPQGIASR